MRGGNRRGHRIFRQDFFHAQAGGAIGLALELGGLRGGEKVRGEKVPAEQRGDEFEGLGGRMVPGHIARGMAIDEGELRFAAQDDGADKEILQRGVRAARLAAAAYRAVHR